VDQFLAHNGYLTVFVTVAFSGEFGLFTGIALAQTGAVTTYGVIAVGTLASFIGNTFYYYAGRFLWNKIGYLKKSFGAKVTATSRIVNRFGSPLMLISRFFYGIRNVIPIALGVYGVNIILFSVYNIAGAFIWSWSFTEAGRLLSIHLVKNFASFRTGLLWGVVTTALIVSLYFSIRRAVSRMQK
jgi:membrane protein DedA with SNARE-associated domain